MMWKSDLSKSDKQSTYWRYDDDTDQPEWNVLRPKPNLTKFVNVYQQLNINYTYY